ncbi:hypothetical protein SSX86_017812 [Deinandra increscens subsp. villosa]|uniref:protein-disulfide reductase n=1 Tax=Deinandra increscens subsp. villosa TaxID=3103831 RepID=A0AAP0CVV4_9ASTR
MSQDDQVPSINTTPEPPEMNTTTAVNHRHKYSSLLASDHRDFLLSPTGAKIKISDLEDKTVGIYFSANWYPQCQTFTQLLIQVYNQIQAQKKSNFEIIFVSSDEDLDAFNNFYQSHMPWLAVPFSDLETKRALNKRFDIEGIPCLIILQPDDDDNDDESVLRDGVELIYRYGAEAHPFTNERLDELSRQEKEKHERQTLLNLLTDDNDDRDFVLAHSTSKEVLVSSLMGKTIGLYFSAQWCFPSHKFTPKLISIYQKIKQNITQQELNEEQEDFEIIYVSSDHNELEFNSSFSVMPWLALPFGDSTSKKLTKYFDIRGIPSLIILGPDGKTVTKNGRSLINLYEEEAYPFTEARVELLEKQMDEDAKNLPSVEIHSGHHHELVLVSQGNGGGPFICCDCDEQGSGWAYQCIECGYEVHTKCVRPVVMVSSGSRFFNQSYLNMEFPHKNVRQHRKVSPEVYTQRFPATGGHERERGAIVAIAVGSALILALLLLILLLCLRKKRNQQSKQAPKPPVQTPAAGARAVTEAGTSSSKDDITGASAEGERNKLVFFEGGIYSFDLEDLLRASAEVFGEGERGDVV